MKKIALFLCSTLCFGMVSYAETIAQWNFNAADPAGGPLPSVGSGTASLVGGVVGNFFSGAGSTDPAATGNNAWSAATYPAVGAGNKTAGMQYNVSTVGRENIIITWDQRNSATGTRYARLQYTTDGTTFVDGPVMTMTVDSSFVNGMNADLSAISEINNNPNFGFRIVAEFESTATGAGTEGYVATKTGSNYSTSGTTRFDMMTVSGNYGPGANTPPSISGFSDETIRVNTSTGPLPVTVGDAQTSAALLVLSGTSSNPTLVPEGNITFGGSAESRTVNVTPAADEIGTATITVRVTDEGGLFVSSNFVLTVLPTNTAPIVPGIETTTGVANTATVVNFTVDDLETANTLNVTASSSRSAILPNSNVVVGGSGTSKTLTLTSVGGYSGPAMVTVTAADTLLSTSTNFVFYAAPSENVLLVDGFDYSDGSVVTNSSSVWKNHSGTAGGALIVGGKLELSSDRFEDINAPLTGAPYDPNEAGPIFAKFEFTVTTLPASTNGDYFAHFKDSGNTFRGKLFVSTNNAAPGSFRLGVSRSANAPASVEIAQDLDVDTTYTVVTRYNVGTGVTAIWLDPSSQSDPATFALDSGTTPLIMAYAFRQSSGIGTILISDVVVANNFADALFTPGAIPIPSGPVALVLTKDNNTIQISWTTADAAYVLQSVSTIDGTWGTASETPVQVGDTYTVTINSPSGNNFYRLVKP